jgi:hypothetical protein
MTLHINVRLIYAGLVLVGIVGVLVVIYGVYSVIDMTNRYNQLSALELPPMSALQNTTPNDPTVIMLAQVARDKRDLLSQRAQATSLVGVGAVILGAAVLIYLRLPDQPSTARPGKNNAAV